MIRAKTMFRTGFMALSVILSWLVMAPVTRAEVTWPDLLADPDNTGLNRQFVSERLASGDLPAALSAVERLIVQCPTDIPARILRAEILVNLANDTLAAGELEALARLPLLPEQAKRIGRMRDIIETRSRRWRSTASLSLGVRGSDNANNYPSSGLLDFKLNATSPATTRQYESYGGATKTMREVAGIASASVTATYEFPNQDRDTLTFSLSHAEARGRKYDYLTSSTTTAFAGASRRLGQISIRPDIRLTETHQKTDPGSTIASGGLTVFYSLPLGIQSYVNSDYSVVNRIPSTKFSTANQNDGHSRSFKLGLSGSLLPQLTLFAEGRYTAFNPMETRFPSRSIAYTQSKANQNRRQAGTISALFAPTPNLRLRASIDASDSKYDNQDPTSKRYRRDTQNRASIGLQIAGQAVSRKFEDFSLAISAATTKNDSNLKQNDYKRADASITVTYRLAD